MDRRLFIVLVFCSLLSLSFHAKANNVKIEGEPVVELNAAKNGLEINFTLSWENSWRDEFNWDAVWIFVKYKYVNGTAEWSHLLLNDAHEVPADMAYESGKNSSQTVGVFVYRKGQGIGNLTNKKIKLSAPLGSISAADMEGRKVYFAASALEMVLVPTGAYRLGDSVSANSFFPVEKTKYGIIPEADDIVNLKSGYTITASQAAYPASNAADHKNNASDIGSSWYANSGSQQWWKIDFKTVKNVKFFGVSGSTQYVNYKPSALWYLEGSNDDVNWETLNAIDPSLWVANPVSYPVQQSIKVMKPGAYRYYRLFIPNTNWVTLQNIAMTEKVLYDGESGIGCLIDAETGIRVGANEVKVSLPDAYPKGYAGFYCMKYELSQEQYVSFLNMLSYSQQKGLVGGVLDGLVKGDYIFGDKTKPDNRNGICVLKHNGTALPAVFANNLNPAEPFSAPDDGQTLACNYMSPVSVAAYLDWAGLRPLSEMEFEKACRKPYPYLTPDGDYAWNTTILNRVNAKGDLTGIATESEKPTDSNKNANAGNNLGPIRCGAFSASNSTQQQSGATFYGIMEMSGNLSELCFNAAGAYTAGHGDGAISSVGLANVPTWPANVSAYCLRGGSFASAESCLRVSDRSMMSTSNVQDSTVTFRGVRSAAGSSTLNAGSIIGENGQITDTVCPGVPFTIRSAVDAQWSDGPDMPITYLWYIDNVLIPNEVGPELRYALENSTSSLRSVTISRKAICVVGEKSATSVKIKIPNPEFALNRDSLEIDICGFAKESEVIMVMNNPNAVFSWTYKGNLLKLGTAYRPEYSHFDRADGTFEIICGVNTMSCTEQVKLFLNILPRPVVVNSNEITFYNCGDVLFKDSRDGQEYCSVKISDNLCLMGTNLKYQPAYHYDDVYGSYYMANYNPTTICPEGWYAPNETEMNTLKSNQVLLNSLKYQLGGYSTPSCSSCNIEGHWWCSPGSPNGRAYTLRNNSTSLTFSSYNTVHGRALRCMKKISK